MFLNWKSFHLTIAIFVVQASLYQSLDIRYETGFTATDAAAAADNGDNVDLQSLRQTHSTFVQWVLSLLPYRPPASVAIEVPTSLSPLQYHDKNLTSSTAGISSATMTSIDGVITSAAPTSLNTASSLITIEATTSVSTSAIASTSTDMTTARPATTTLPSLASTSTTPVTTVLNPPRNCSYCVCGIANTQKRIVGGEETEVHQYPWMSMLLYGGRFYCAASLINDQYLVTASHCVYGFRRERITVRLLEHDRKMSSVHSIDRKVAQIITHPKYNARNYDNDIAIIKLSKPVEFSALLHPVCMPTPGKSFKGEYGIVTGWGAVKIGGATSDTLQEIQVPIMSQQECRQSNYGPARITDNMLCAGYEAGIKDSCQGDSGGPLHVVVAGTREHQLAGVVSWGEGCAKPGYPGVYSRVNRYGTWIKTLTRNACICQSEIKKIKK